MEHAGPTSETNHIPTLNCDLNVRLSCQSAHSSSTPSDGWLGNDASLNPWKKHQYFGIQRNNKSPVQDRKNPVMHLVLGSFRFNYISPTSTPIRPTSIENSVDLSSQQSEASEEAQLTSPISNCLSPSPKTPTFTIPTSNSLRKAKMDRLRKRLGSEVPVDLVFRDNDPQGPSYAETRCESNRHPLSPLPKKLTKRSSNSSARMKRPRTQEGCITNTTPASSDDLGRVKGQLTFIQESPDEYLPEHKEVVITFPRVKQPIHRSLRTGDSRNSCRGSVNENWTYDLGTSTITKRSPSYRKPPPPIVENLV